MRFVKIKEGIGDYTSYDTSSLNDALKTEFGTNFTLANTDQGEQISFDVMLKAEIDTPANQQIVRDIVLAHGSASAVLQRYKDKKITENRIQAKTIIEAKYPPWYQINCQDGTYSDTIADDMKAKKVTVIAEENRCADLIDACTTKEQVDAVTPNWPVI